MPKRPGDYFLWHKDVAYILEVKELKLDYRLPRSRLTQLAKMKLFGWAGCLPMVVVYHTEIKAWRIIPSKLLSKLMNSDDKSIDMRGLPTYKTADEAIGGAISFV